MRKSSALSAVRNGGNWTDLNSQETTGCRIFSVREGFVPFDSLGPAAGWLENQRKENQFVYNTSGLAIAWRESTSNKSESEISVDVYQVLVNSKRPSGIIGGDETSLIDKPMLPRKDSSN